MSMNWNKLVHPFTNIEVADSQRRGYKHITLYGEDHKNDKSMVGFLVVMHEDLSTVLGHLKGQIAMVTFYGGASRGKMRREVQDYLAMDSNLIAEDGTIETVKQLKDRTTLEGDPIKEVKV